MKTYDKSRLIVFVMVEVNILEFSQYVYSSEYFSHISIGSFLYTRKLSLVCQL